MPNTELRNAINQAVDIIYGTAWGINTPPGELALTLLREENTPLVTRKAALRVRLKELIKQNPPRKGRPI
jgi:hypothetical protein